MTKGKKKKRNVARKRILDALSAFTLPRKLPAKSLKQLEYKRRARLQHYLDKKINGKNAERPEQTIGLYRLRDLNFTKLTGKNFQQNIPFYDDMRHYSRVGRNKVTSLTSTAGEQIICYCIVMMTLFLFCVKFVMLNKNMFGSLQYKNGAIFHFLVIQTFIKMHWLPSPEYDAFKFDVDDIVDDFEHKIRHYKASWIFTISLLPLHIVIPLCLAFKWPRQRLLGKSSIMKTILSVLVITWITGFIAVAIPGLTHDVRHFNGVGSRMVGELFRFEFCLMNMTESIVDFLDDSLKCVSLRNITSEICNEPFPSTDLFDCQSEETISSLLLQEEWVQMGLFVFTITALYVSLIVKIIIQRKKYRKILRNIYHRINYSPKSVTLEHLKDFTFEGNLETDDTKFSLQYLPYTSCLCQNRECPYNNLGPMIFKPNKHTRKVDVPKSHLATPVSASML
ncbi:unnamed protein product [Bursaphelenchus okinawaensis]|uniref:Uncharacterized protein n=1 Tax=Bursaphelenchus okinawaensis TaxID=465554 RepID=A0A811K7H1_9BILA|nr:unnamed protein product [Bursaphelenchus okinawaensis]CAG9094818.1 unnamed protein product [Bursaphelenchus okinawaensis]